MEYLQIETTKKYNKKTMNTTKNEELDNLEKPNYNVILVGSLANGKSTIVKEFCGKDPHSSTKELVRNITMNAGFGNMLIYKNNKNNNLISTNTNKESILKKFSKLKENFEDYNLIKHISFVDCPGHSKILHVPLSNIKLANGAIVVIDVKNDIESKPQLMQHLIGLSVHKIKNIIVCLNKIDLVDERTCIKKMNETKDILNNIGIKPDIIIPTSFTRKINTDLLLFCMNKFFNKTNNKSKGNYMLINRSFNNNNIGISYKKLRGGILGGSIIEGKFNIGDEIEIRPGYTNKGKVENEKMKVVPIKTKILSIYTESIPILKADVNGLIALGTDIEPFYSQNNKLAGCIIGKSEEMPSVYTKIEIKFNVLRNKYCNWIPCINDIVKLFIDTSFVTSKLIKITGKKNIKGTFQLFKPICIRDNSNLMICQDCPNDNIVKIVAEGNFLKGDIILQ
jgi:translation initiation factor 2 subunit 3